MRKNSILLKGDIDSEFSNLDELTNLIEMMKIYSINSQDVLTVNSCCIDKIELDASLSIFKFDTNCNNYSKKPDLPCMYKENLEKIVCQIVEFNPFNKKISKSKKIRYHLIKY